MEKLEVVRHKLDQVTREIGRLLQLRHDLASALRSENQNGRPPEASEPEDGLIADAVRGVPGSIPPQELAAIVRELVTASRKASEDSAAGDDLRVANHRGDRLQLFAKGRLLQGLVAGPCAIESAAQLESVARAVSAAGLGWLRAGVWKPRTHPGSFQGLGKAGLTTLGQVRARHDLATISEVLDPRHFELIRDEVDVVQIGARNMYNYPLLTEAGRFGKPVLLKRGLAATLREWVLAAEYIARTGNEQIVLCERGIRTFETATRNTLDLSSVPILIKETRLPVMVDVSHALGRRDVIPDMILGALAVGACAVMVEVHPAPTHALSDGPQQLSLDDLATLQTELRIKARARLGSFGVLPSSVPTG